MDRNSKVEKQIRNSTLRWIAAQIEGAAAIAELQQPADQLMIGEYMIIVGAALAVPVVKNGTTREVRS